MYSCSHDNQPRCVKRFVKSVSVHLCLGVNFFLRIRTPQNGRMPVLMIVECLLSCVSARTFNRPSQHHTSVSEH